MSINISAAQQRHSKSINITYDFNTFGPRQRTAMFRAARTGLLKGNSVSNDIAKGLRTQHGLGSIHFRPWAISWHNLTSNDFDPITIALATCKLKGTTPYWNNGDSFDKQQSDGWLHIRGSRPPNMSLGSNLRLEDLVANIEAGHITELTVPL